MPELTCILYYASIYSKTTASNPPPKSGLIFAVNTEGRECSAFERISPEETAMLSQLQMIISSGVHKSQYT